MKLLNLLLCMPVFSAVSFGAAAAAYPDKPVRMVVPGGPGGGSDVSGRIVAAGLEARPGKSSQELDAFVANDVARWADVIKRANIKMD